jgi:hypothetical protein
MDETQKNENSRRRVTHNHVIHDSMVVPRAPLAEGILTL